MLLTEMNLAIIIVHTVKNYYISLKKPQSDKMSEEQNKFGLPVGTKAPLFEAVDVEKQPVNLQDLLTENKGVLLDFFRGAW